LHKSQNRYHVAFPLPSGLFARNMGKNDLWIAATALLLEATLITTDNGFNHLLPFFIEIEKVIP
jgi:tRNA(fMet)-specific endonuclease VapC